MSEKRCLECKYLDHHPQVKVAIYCTHKDMLIYDDDWIPWDFFLGLVDDYETPDNCPLLAGDDKKE